MRMLNVFAYTLLRNLRDKGSMAQMVLLPVVLILILGIALNPAFQPYQISPVPVGYLHEDRGPAGDYFEQFIRSDEIGAILEVKAVSSREEGLDGLKEGRFSAFVYLPDDFSLRPAAGEKAAIEIAIDPAATLNADIVENVLESFIHGANAVEAVHRLGLAEPAYTFSGGGIVERPLAASGIRPGAMDYYAVTMLVMIIMYGSLYACFGMRESYLAAAGRRIKSSPIRGAEHYVGLVLANVVTVYLQVLVVLAFTRYAYNVNWGDNLPLILLITFTLVLLSTGLGTLIGMVARNEMIAGGVLNVLIPAFTFIAGGYFKFTAPGPFFAALQHVSPNYLAQTAIFNTIYGGPAAQTAAFLGAMWLIILGTFAAAVAVERRKSN